MIARAPDPITMNLGAPYRLGRQTGVCTDIMSRADETRRFGRIRQTDKGYVAFAADGEMIGRYKGFQEAASVIAAWGARHIERRWVRQAVPRAVPAPAGSARRPAIAAADRLCVEDLAPVTVPALRTALAGLFTRSFREAKRDEIVSLIVDRVSGEHVPFFWRNRRADLLARLDRLGVAKAGALLALLGN